MWETISALVAIVTCHMHWTYFLLRWHILFPSPSVWLPWRFLLGLLSLPSPAPSCSPPSPPLSTPVLLFLPVFTPPLPSPSSAFFRCDLGFLCSDCPPPRLPLRVWWCRRDGLSSEPGPGITVASNRTWEVWWWCSPLRLRLLSVDSPRSKGGLTGPGPPPPPPATWLLCSWRHVCLWSSSAGWCWLKQ